MTQKMPESASVRDALEPLMRRFKYYAEMNDEQFKPFLELPFQRESFAAGSEIMRKDEDVERLYIIEKGWGIRYQILEDGRRQVLNALLPGDIFDFQIFISNKADHSVKALTEMHVLALIEPSELLRIFRQSARISLAFWWVAVQEEAILREQIVRNGRRSATESIAHFLLEMQRRAQIIGEGGETKFRFPLSQAVIGDALGLTSIHVNRLLRRFHKEEMIFRKGQWIEILQKEKLAEICDYDPSYLHLDSFKRRLTFNKPLWEAQ